MEMTALNSNMNVLPICYMAGEVTSKTSTRKSLRNMEKDKEWVNP